MDCPVDLRVSSPIHRWVGPRPRNLRNCSGGSVRALPSWLQLRLQTRTFRLCCGGDSEGYCQGLLGAPSSASDDEGSVDSGVAGAAFLAIAEAQSPADLAGAFPDDLAGAFPADLVGAFSVDLAGMVFPAVLAEMAVPAVVGVASPAILAGMAGPSCCWGGVPGRC